MMAGGILKRALIDAIRDLRGRVEALERTPGSVCEAAPVAVPPCVAIGPRGGCLITPRHAVHAWHNPLKPGDTVRYAWGTRTVAGVRNVAGTDIAIATLDADADCEPAAVLPWDWPASLRTDRSGERLKRPVRCFGTRGNGDVAEARLQTIGPNWAAPGPWALGDSGQPVWLPTERPVLVGCHHYRGFGPAVHHHWAAVWRITAADGLVPSEAEW